MREAGWLSPTCPSSSIARVRARRFRERRVEPDRLDQLVSDPQNGVERGERVLIDHRHSTATDRCELAVAHRRQLGVAAHRDRAAREDERRAEQSHQREGGDRLAAPRLAHERQPLATSKHEPDVVHKLGRGASRAKLDPEALDEEGRRLVRRASFGNHLAPAADEPCRDRARTLSSSNTSTMAAAGNAA